MCAQKLMLGGAAVLALLTCSPTSHGQCCGSSGCGSAPRAKDSCYGGGAGGTDKLSAPEPYGGQLFCPVTGEKLGLRRPPVPVQTTVGEKKPSFMGKVIGKKGTPGAVIHVCCPDCAAKVQSNPLPYMSELIADRACFAYTYASAPAKRPARARTEDSAHPEIAATSMNAAQK